MTTLLSISALLITVLLMQMGTGALGPLDTISGIQLGFTTIEIGIIGAAHFTGFIIGCFGAPALVRRVGHARAYIVTVALSVIAILLHPIFLYFGPGVCSGCLPALRSPPHSPRLKAG